MAALIAKHDWSKSLGPIETWPQSLKTTVGLMIHSPVALVLLWGPDGIMIYNDGYSVFAGNRHPSLLGSKVLEGWPEAAELNAHVMKTCMAGGTLQYKDLELALNRRGQPEPGWMDLFYSPVIDESGKPGGVIAVVVETTERVLAERAAVAQRERLAQMFQNAPSFMCQMDGPEHVFSFANAAYQQLIAHRNVIGKTVRDALPEIAGQGFYELLDQVYASGEGYRGYAVPVTLHRTAGAAPEQRLLDFVYQPVRDSAGTVTGIFAEGHDVTDSERNTQLLAENEERLRIALSASDSVGTWDWDIQSDRVVADAGFATLYGVDPERARTGAPVAEFFQGIHADDVARVQAEVAASMESGEPFSSEYRLVQPNGSEKWVIAEGRCTFSPDGKPVRFAGLSFDITRRKAAEIRREALVRLTDSIRDLDDVNDLAFAASTILGETLNVSRVSYGTIDADAETLTVERDWRAPGVESLAGTLNLRDYGSFIDSLKAGEFVVVPDVDKDPRTAAAADALKKRGAGAFVNVAVMEKGRLVAVLFLNNATPRAWTNEDLSLVEEIAERTRTATERLRAGNALRGANADLVRSEQRLQLALDAAQMGSFVWHVAEDMAEGDARMMALFGLPSDGLLTLRTALAESIDPRDAPRYAAAVGRAIDPGGNGMLREDIRVRLPDGTLRWLAITGQVTFVDGRAKQMAGAARDITESRNAEAALRESEAQFRTMAQAMPNHVWTATPDGLLDWLSDPTYTYAGAAPRTLLGNDWTAIVHPDDLTAAGALWAKARETGSIYEAEFRLRRHDGQWRWHIARAVPVTDADGHISRWVGTNTDIQEHKEVAVALEEFNATLEQRVEQRTTQLQQAEEALRQSQKMEAVGQLTGGLAHDFNNLLQGITGALDRVQHRIEQGRLGDVDRFLKAAVESANRAAALTHRLLAFSRRQTLDAHPIETNRLVTGMEDLIRRTMGPYIRVEVVGAAGAWPINVDPSQLENAILNLCINARDAMPDGGSLTIETANKWLDDRAAKERELPPGQYVSLCVTDTGTGMTPEVIARAFDPFFTTKPLGRGTGLGLSMIYGFVRQSGGQVRVYSELNQGTTMCLYFPRHVGAVESDAPAMDDRMERGFGETVLVVDDEETVRMLVAEVLSENFYHIVEAGDGAAALKILETDRRIDLMITDVGLPGGMNGRQVADAARLLRPGLKVLFITGYAENAAVGSGQLEAGMQILAKPFAMSTLANKVREIIET